MKRLCLSSIHLLSVAALCLLATLHASHAANNPKAEARIDISGGTEIDINVTATGAATDRADWEGAQALKQVIIRFPATSEWKESKITVTPSQDGTIYLALLGPYVKVSAAGKEIYPIRVCYDNISADNADIKNGSFEETSAPGKVEGWRRLEKPTGEPAVTEANRAEIATGDAPEGTHFAKVWHHSQLVQSITVRGGQPITITFSYRLEKP